ncbi:MAG: hypothetical protein ACF8Q5_12205 [Phycisphaerales bacterium JB040]
MQHATTATLLGTLALAAGLASAEPPREHAIAPGGCVRDTEDRLETALFLLGEQDMQTEHPTCVTFEDTFFEGRPDPMALRPMYAEELLARFDENGDGLLKGQERTTAQVYIVARQAQYEVTLRERFDADESGELSTDERCEARQWLFHEHVQTLNELVDRFDANDDGGLRGHELSRAREISAEQFFTAHFYEGSPETLVSRFGPELAYEHAERYESRAEHLEQWAESQQQTHLNSVLAMETFTSGSRHAEVRTDTP